MPEPEKPARERMIELRERLVHEIRDRAMELRERILTDAAGQ
jgi:hypothetical protein